MLGFDFAKTHSLKTHKVWIGVRLLGFFGKVKVWWLSVHISIGYGVAGDDADTRC